MRITPTSPTTGATISGIDLNQPLSAGDFRTILRALGPC